MVFKMCSASNIFRLHRMSNSKDVSNNGYIPKRTGRVIGASEW